MHTQFIIASADVEKLKQQARKLKRDTGISHHEALDQVAKAAGFNHWHHVSESADAFKSTEDAYRFGVIIAMDVKDAMDFRDPTGGFVEDQFAFALCQRDLLKYFQDTFGAGEDEPHEKLADDPEERFADSLTDQVFFRYTGSKNPATAEAVVMMVQACESSIWSPDFIWLKGVFHERPNDQAINADGEVIGIRF